MEVEEAEPASTVRSFSSKQCEGPQRGSWVAGYSDPTPIPPTLQQPPAPANGMEEDAAAVAPPPNAKSAAHGSPLRLYTAHFLLGQPADDEGAEGAADAKLLHQYLYEHPNGLFIVGLGDFDHIVFVVACPPAFALPILPSSSQ